MPSVDGQGSEYFYSRLTDSAQTCYNGCYEDKCATLSDERIGKACDPGAFTKSCINKVNAYAVCGEQNLVTPFFCSDNKCMETQHSNAAANCVETCETLQARRDVCITDEENLGQLYTYICQNFEVSQTKGWTTESKTTCVHGCSEAGDACLILSEKEGEACIPGDKYTCEGDVNVFCDTGFSDTYQAVDCAKNKQICVQTGSAGCYDACSASEVGKEKKACVGDQDWGVYLYTLQCQKLVDDIYGYQEIKSEPCWNGCSQEGTPACKPET